MHMLRALVATAALAAAGQAAAQSSAEQTVASTGTIFQPIILTKTADLEFGTVVRPASGNGTVVVDASSGQRSLAGQGGLISSGASPSRAAFTVSGEGAQTFSINVPPSMTLTRSGGSETISVALTPSAGTGTLTGTPGGAGTASFGVGGQLPVSNGTTLGAYTGTFTVTVAYN